MYINIKLLNSPQTLCFFRKGRVDLSFFKLTKVKTIRLF